LSGHSCTNIIFRTVDFGADGIGFHHNSGYCNCGSGSDLNSKHFSGLHEVGSSHVNDTCV